MRLPLFFLRLTRPMDSSYCVPDSCCIRLLTHPSSPLHTEISRPHFPQNPTFYVSITPVGPSCPISPPPPPYHLAAAFTTYDLLPFLSPSLAAAFFQRRTDHGSTAVRPDSPSALKSGTWSTVERKPLRVRFAFCVPYRPRVQYIYAILTLRTRNPKFGPDGEYLGVQWQDKRVGLKEMEFIRKWEESQTPEERRLEREWQRQQNALLFPGHRRLIPPRPKPTAATGSPSEVVAGPSKTTSEKVQHAVANPGEVQPELKSSPATANGVLP
ncbi:hypothetical protein VTO73DRAFT_6464 [Trametes versicolor]